MLPDDGEMAFRIAVVSLLLVVAWLLVLIYDQLAKPVFHFVQVDKGEPPGA